MIDLTPIGIGLAVGLPGSVLGWRGYKHATRKDDHVETAAVIVAQTGQVAQVIAGLNQLIDYWRGNFTEVVKERDACREELARSRERVKE